MTTSNTVVSSRSAVRESFAQLGDLVVIVNGMDANKVHNMRAGETYDMGLATPAAPSGSAGASGLVTGSVRYRIRWWDASTGSLSLPGAEVTVACTNQIVTVTAPGSVPSRASHWILERTTDGGRLFFPVNRTSAAPNGTIVATTTFADNVSDGILRQRDQLTDCQAPLPCGPRFLFTNRSIMFALGRTKKDFSVGLTKSSTGVSGSGFTAGLAGRDISLGLATGVTYTIASVTSSTAMVLEKAYPGNSGTFSATIAGRGDVLYWSEAGNAEHWGSRLANGLTSQQLTIGDDGEQLISGCGLGPAGVLLAKRDRLYILSYEKFPHPLTGDGMLVTVPVRRGACGPLAMRSINGFVYGIDSHGIWRMAPGAAPEEIGGPLQFDWKREFLNWAEADRWHIGYDPASRQIHFFVSTDNTYPRTSYVFDEEQSAWMGMWSWPLGIGCTVELPDISGQSRMVVYQVPDTTAASLSSSAYMVGVGTTFGTLTSNLPLSATVVTDVVSEIDPTPCVRCAEASWPASGLVGLPVNFRRPSTGAEELAIITANGSDYFTHTGVGIGEHHDFGPQDGDVFEIGPLSSRYRSGRINCGDCSRKKRFYELWINAKYKTICTPFFVRIYVDGASEPYNFGQTRDEDGVSYTANTPDVMVDPTEPGRQRFRIPLQNLLCNDITIEIRSTASGIPWEICGMKLVWDWDPSEVPPDK